MHSSVGNRCVKNKCAKNKCASVRRKMHAHICAVAGVCVSLLVKMVCIRVFGLVLLMPCLCLNVYIHTFFARAVHTLHGYIGYVRHPRAFLDIQFCAIGMHD
jgi:hypothetical protein